MKAQETQSEKQAQQIEEFKTKSEQSQVIEQQQEKPIMQKPISALDGLASCYNGQEKPITVTFGQYPVAGDLSHLVNIKTQNLKFVPYGTQPNHAKDIYENIYSKPEHMTYFMDGLPRTEERIKHVSNNVYAPKFTDGNVMPRFVVEHKDSVQFAGLVVYGGLWTPEKTLPKEFDLPKQGAYGFGELFGATSYDKLSVQNDGTSSSEGMYGILAYTAFLANGGVVPAYDTAKLGANKLIHYYLNNQNPEHQNIQGVYASAHPKHTIAKQMLEKFGFKHHGTGTREFPTEMQDKIPTQAQKDIVNIINDNIIQSHTNNNASYNIEITYANDAQNNKLTIIKDPVTNNQYKLSAAINKYKITTENNPHQVEIKEKMTITEVITQIINNAEDKSGIKTFDKEGEISRLIEKFEEKQDVIVNNKHITAVSQVLTTVPRDFYELDLRNINVKYHFNGKDQPIETYMYKEEKDLPKLEEGQYLAPKELFDILQGNVSDTEFHLHFLGDTQFCE